MQNLIASIASSCPSGSDKSCKSSVVLNDKKSKLHVEYSCSADKGDVMDVPFNSDSGKIPYIDKR